MSIRLPAAARVAAIVLGLCAPAAAAPAAATAAWLAGGSTQRAIARAFSAQRSHRRDAIVSIRTSSVSSAWAVVRSVTPQTGHQRSGRALVLQSTYYHVVGGRAHPAPPPRRVRADLARDFRVAVVYAGTGGESINYTQGYRSVCAGYGGFTDSETDAVGPMSWRVRYIVDVDHLLSAVRSAGATTLVPEVTFDRRASHVTAAENVSRTVQDLGCNGKPTTFNCRMAFAAGGPDPGGQLAFPQGSGLEVGVPMAARPRGACSPENFTLGPSLWDGGGTTALVGRLGLLGGSLPAHPYAPIRVRWPVDSAQEVQGFVTSPCQGEAAAVCSEAFAWQGTVSLQSVH